MTLAMINRSGEVPKAEPAATTLQPTPRRKKYKLTFKFRTNQIVHQEISHEFELTTSKNQESETVQNSSKSSALPGRRRSTTKTGIADLEMIIDWVHMVATFDKHDGSTIEPVEFQSDDPKSNPRNSNTSWLRSASGPGCVSVRRAPP